MEALARVFPYPPSRLALLNHTVLTSSPPHALTQNRLSTLKPIAKGTLELHFSSGEAVSPSPEGSVAQLERLSEGNILAQVLSFFACKVKGSPGSPQHLRLHSRSEPAR